VSAVADAIMAIREALKLAEDVRQLGKSLKGISQEIRDHEHRITRLEAKWEAAIEIVGLCATDSARHIEFRG